MTRNMETTASLRVTWQHPAFLLPLFCLCVLLGSTQTLTLALASAVIMLVLTLLCTLVYALVPRQIHPQATLLWLVLAGLLTALVEVLLHAWRYPLYQQLDLFLPMMALCAVLLARGELRDTTPSMRHSFGRAWLMSGGYALAAVVLGAGRELVGRGSLFLDAGSLWGAWAAPLELHVFRADRGFLLAVLAPGAFVALGLGVALYNRLMSRHHRGADSDLPA